MNKLTREKRVQIIKALVEGNSIRATARMCDAAFNAVPRLLPEIGKACAGARGSAGVRGQQGPGGQVLVVGVARILLIVEEKLGSNLCL